MSARALLTPLPSHTPASGSGIVAKSHRRSVLLIDPDAGSRYLLAQWLCARYDIVEAEDGLQAVMLAKLMPAPALVVCEVALPNVDGFTVAKLLKVNAQLRSVPLVFLTSRTSADDIAQGMSVGARRYLFKPFVAETVCGQLAKMIDP